MVNSLIYPFPPMNHAVQDHTAYWENFFTEDELQKIESLSQWESNYEALVGDGRSEVNRPSQRVTDINWLKLTNETQFVWDRISQVIMSLNNQYFHFDLDGIYEEIQLGIYDSEKGGHYDWHIDVSANGAPRKLSFAMLLSDPKDFEGGQLEIKTESNTPMQVPQARGRAWVFPSVFLHRVTPVTKGIRKSLVVWAGGPAFR